MNEDSQRVFEFGPFRLDVAEHVLLREGKPVPLTPKAFELLVALVEHGGRLVEKEHLIKTLWPDTFAGDSNLNSNVSTLRKALGQVGDGHRYIETVPTRGYRFKVPGRESADVGEGLVEELVLEKHTLTRVTTEEDGRAGGGDDLQPLPARASLPAGTVARRRSGWGLRGVALGLLCLLLVGVSAALYYSRTSAESRGEEPKVAGRPPLRSIAVLPFKAIGAEGASEYLSLGMTDALITRLGNVRRVVVRPTSAVRRYSGPLQDPLAAAREQGVEAVLDGSVQRAGDRVRVTVQLYRARDGASLWSAKFDERFTDIFAVQDSISRQVMRELLVELNPEEAEQLKRRGSENVKAYEAYLMGLYFWDKRNKEGYRAAVKYFSRAVELDPTFAEAYVGLGNAYAYLGGHDRASQAEAIARQRAGVLKALALDDTLAEAHATLGLIEMDDGDWPAAESEFKRALALNPNYATAHQWYGEFLAWVGRADEGLAESQRARELDPLSLTVNTDVAKIYLLSRRYDDAVAQFKSALELDPDFEVAHGLLALTYSKQGRHEEALRELRGIRNLESDPMYLSFLVYVYGEAGMRDEARRSLRRLNDLSRQTYVTPQWRALASAGLGDKDEAFKWLDRIFEDHAQGKITVKVAPVWDGLRSDPRFEELLRRADF